MPIEITSESTSRCDAKGCRNSLDVRDYCYCDSCYEELLDKITELEKEIEKLKEEEK